MSDELPKYKCKNCNEDYEYFMHCNFNLGLCEKCLKSFEESGKIKRDEQVDVVSHKITCPKCKRRYLMIVDNKCDTLGCPVWFFWDELDSKVFARWIEDDVVEEVKE